MIKSLSISVVLFFIALGTSFSQVDFGFDVAMGASRLRIDNPSETPNLFETETNPFAMNFGPSLTVGLKDKWSFHVSLDFSFNPSNLLFNGDTTYSVSSSFAPVEKKYQNLFVELPVMLRYHFASRDKLLSPFVGVGAVYDYQLLETCPEGLECLNHTRDHNLGAIFGLGVEFWKLTVGAKAQLGLFNMITEDYNIDKDDLQISKDLLLVEVGYTF